METSDIDNKIKQQFRSKFNNFESEPPADGWDKLEASLNAASVAKFIHRRWYAGVAAAAILALMVGGALFLWGDTEQVEASEVAYTSHPETIVATPTQQQEIEKVSQIEVVAPTYTAAVSHSAQPILAQVPDIIAPQIDSANIPETVEEISIEHPQTQPERTIENQPNIRPTYPTALISGSLSSLTGHLPRPGRRREPISVAVSGSGGLAPFHIAAATPMTLRAVTVETDEMMAYSPFNAPSHEAEKEHAPPISIGATVSIPLAPNLFLETGLVYSFLYSRTRNNNVNRHEQESQHLHYLGIPIILNYRVLQTSSVNLYVSAGGMIEQGIYGEFQREMYGLQTQMVATRAIETVRVSQSNPQLSISAGVGASIPIHNRLRLQGRIGGAYYFDARNAHRTIYSDRKIVLNVNLGVRFDI